MNTKNPTRGWSARLVRAAGALLLAAGAASAFADAADLRAKYEEVQASLQSNPYRRAMHIDSAETDRSLRGDVYAVLDHPFAKVSQSLREPGQWCDVLILPFNTKYCHAPDSGDRLAVRIGRKFDQPVEQAYKLEFAYRLVASSADYFETRLNAPQGPIGTRDYRIAVRAIPLGDKTFLHLSYAYGFGTAGRIAMQAYLATAGADKVGFSISGRDAGGQPQYMGGVRGAVERNAMRYYLAIDAYLDSVGLARNQQVEKRIQAWFNATEQYPRQLREMDRATYVAMKRSEYERQQTALLQ
jgi:hypothetical protein